MSEFNQEEFEDSGEKQSKKQKIASKMSAVATSPKKNLLIIILMVLAAGYFIYSVIFGGGEKEPTNNLASPEQEELKVDDSKTIKAPTITEDEEDFAPPPSASPNLPEPPPLVAPEPPQSSAPAPLEIQGNIPEPDPLEITRKKGKSQERLASSMFVSSGGSNSNRDEQNSKPKENIYDEDDQYFVYGNSGFEKSKATRYGVTTHSIAQGKIIDAVLESSINTDLPGPIRAIVSRNIYAESGKNILVPRGSRLIGKYDTGTTTGVNRVAIIWTRLIRPDGIDLNLSSPAIDSLGKAGVSGFFDNKLFEILRNAALISALKITVSKASNSGAITNTTTTQADGTSTSSQSGSATNLAVKDAIDDLGQTAEDVLKRSVAEKPRIIIDQGTLIKVFVNKDLVFPVGEPKQ